LETDQTSVALVTLEAHGTGVSLDALRPWWTRQAPRAGLSLHALGSSLAAHASFAGRSERSWWTRWSLIVKSDEHEAQLIYLTLTKYFKV
jgi:hypothetical protein